MKPLIKNLKSYENKEVTLKGWVQTFRSSGKIFFLVLRDGTGSCQCVFSEENSDKESFNLFSEINMESSVEVTGQVKKWKDSFELQGKTLKIISKSTGLYPLGKKSHGVDFLVSNRHLWLRSKKQQAIAKIRNTLIQNIHHFLQKEGFLHVDAPLLTPMSCEGTSNLFEVNFFDEDKVFLSQTGQLYMEAAAAAYGNVYSFGPTFRAEKSSTRKHLLEFWMVEPEMAFCDYKEAMSLVENLLEYTIQNTLSSHGNELKILDRNIEFLKKIKAPFHRISYEEASALLQKNSSNFEPGRDLGAEDETFISSQFEKPVFIHRYPKQIKAFYMKEDPQDSNASLSFDLIATEGYGEVVGGGQREDSLDKLLSEIKNHGLKEKDFDWYLDLRRFGSFPHSGFGVGLERLVSWACGLQHVREAIAFPRFYGRSFFEDKKNRSSDT